MKLDMIVWDTRDIFANDSPPRKPNQGIERVSVDTKSPGFELAAAGAPKKRAKSLSFSLLETSNSAERQELRRQPGIIAAPLMPMRLIEPLNADGRAGDNPPSISWGLKAIRAPKSTDAGSGVVVAVLDTGIDVTHPAFAGMTLKRRNFTDDDNGADDSGDKHGHGTHCAGTIFGRDVGGHRIGIARGVKKALIGKVIGDHGGSTAAVLQAINWALSEGAQVISMSLGMDFVGFRDRLRQSGLGEQTATSMALAAYRDTIRLFDKVSGAISSATVQIGSAVVVAASGNESSRPDFSITTAPPAAAEHFVAVGAIGPEAKNGYHPIAPFSNEGAKFAAPGVNIWSAKPGGGLVALSGTSMATPHVAGVAAVFAAQSIGAGFQASRVIESMRQAALPLPGVAPSDVSDGLVQCE